MSRPKLYKILNAKGYSCNGGTMRWDLPKKRKNGWKKGKWTKQMKGQPMFCSYGLHLTNRWKISYWISFCNYFIGRPRRIFEVEIKSGVRVFKGESKYVTCGPIRLVKECTINNLVEKNSPKYIKEKK